MFECLNVCVYVFKRFECLCARGVCICMFRRVYVCGGVFVCLVVCVFVCVFGCVFVSVVVCLVAYVCVCLGVWLFVGVLFG